MDKGSLMPYEGLLLDYNRDGWGAVKLQTYLGGGRYGDLFHGVEEGTGKDVIIKIIRNVESDFERNWDLLERMAALDTGHIHSLISFQNWNPTTWVILFEYIEAQSLDKIIEDEGAFDISDLKHYMTHLIKALHTAHGANIIHRDIKPANILISGHSRGSPGILKLTGFPIFDISDYGVRVGPAPTYMCPDVYAKGGKEASLAADTYSFGVIIAEMLLGKHPWSEDYAGIFEVYKAQKEKGQDWMLPDAPVPSGGEDIWELARHCTKFDLIERQRGWEETTKRIPLSPKIEN